MSSPNAPIEALLAHAHWVRHLATRLVHHDRDDAVQESWLAVLRSPPDAQRPARPWLARVLQNAARKRFRDDSARIAREEVAAAGPEDGLTPEHIVEHAQLHRLLVELVLGLDEPLRQVVLLRYFEGQSAADIARAQKIPAGTVRFRLKQGLDQLRDALERQHGQAWSLLMAPLVFPTSNNVGTIGVVVMAKKATVALVGGLTLVGAVLLLVPTHCEEAAPQHSAVEAPITQLPAPEHPVTARPTTAPSPMQNSAAPFREANPPQLAAPPAVVPTRSPNDVVRAGSDPSVGREPLPDQQRNQASDAGPRYSIDKDGIRAAAAAASSSVRDCYSEWLKVQPTLGGKVSVLFTIKSDDGVEGKVVAVSLGDAGLGNFAMEGCILSAFEGLRFEDPMNGQINVRYPLTLSPDPDGGP